MGVIAIYPGTFDPITLGHIDIINRAVKIFSKVIIAVAEESNKQPLFSSAERLKMAEAEVQELGIDHKLVVKSFNGLLVDFAKIEKATVIIRGLRAVSDFEYEFQMSYVNYKLAPELETFFIPAGEKSQFIASRFVREIARLKGELSSFVSNDVAEKLRKKFEKNGE